MPNENRYDYEEDRLDKELSFELPQNTRLCISLPISLLILSILGVYGYLILCNPKHIDPSQYGFSTTLIALIITLIVINIPWNKMGFRIKKIGMIELENVVKTQSQGNAKELADLQKQIDELKAELSPTKLSADKNNKLDDLVKKFLEKYNRWAFSGLRIKSWGSRQTGFEELKDYETREIKESLRRLLFNEYVVTRISKKGNTIYKIK